VKILTNFLAGGLSSVGEFQSEGLKEDMAKLVAEKM
jgi:hypothetical protein